MAFPFWPKPRVEKNESERARLDELDAKLQQFAAEEEPLIYVDRLVARLEQAGSGPEETVSRILERASADITTAYEQQEHLKGLDPILKDERKAANWDTFEEATESVAHVAQYEMKRLQTFLGQLVVLASGLEGKRKDRRTRERLVPAFVNVLKKWKEETKAGNLDDFNDLLAEVTREI